MARVAAKAGEHCALSDYLNAGVLVRCVPRAWVDTYRKFKRPFRAVCRVGGGRASAGLRPLWARIGRLCAGFRHRGATQRLGQEPFFADSRQRAERSPAGLWPHRVGWRFRRRPFDCAQDRLCGRRGVSVTRPQQAVRALGAGSALAPVRRVCRSGRGWRGWRWVLPLPPRFAPRRRTGCRCSRRC